MSLSYLENASAEQVLQLWKTLHQRQWAKYSADPNNERLIRKAMEKYRLSLTAADRAFADVESHLHRADGKTEADDLREAAARQRVAEEEEARNVVLQPGIHQYAGSLSPVELERAYYNDRNFRLQYNILVRDFGYKLPAAPRAR